MLSELVFGQVQECKEGEACEAEEPMFDSEDIKRLQPEDIDSGFTSALEALKPFADQAFNNTQFKDLLN